MRISTNKIAFLTLIACLFFEGESFAELPGKLYNPHTVTTVSGEVVKIEQISPSGRMGFGVHLILKTSEGEIPVHLGPSGYLSQQGLIIAQGDDLTVTGSKVRLNNKTFIIASKVEKDEKVFVLRDKYGFPMWRGRFQFQ